MSALMLSAVKQTKSTYGETFAYVAGKMSDLR